MINLENKSNLNNAITIPCLVAPGILYVLKRLSKLAESGRTLKLPEKVCYIGAEGEFFLIDQMSVAEFM